MIDQKLYQELSARKMGFLDDQIDPVKSSQLLIFPLGWLFIEQKLLNLFL